MLKVGLIGCGFMGKMHANVYRLLPNAELVGVVDRLPAKRDAFAQEFGVPAFATFGEMNAALQLDAVDICLPTFLHAEATIEAAKAGKHVLCEKPMALTLAESDAMTAAAEAAGVKLMIGHCIRFWPEYAFVKKAVDEGTYGRLLSINLTRYGEFPHWSTDNWLADESLSGGGVLDMHIHDTDFVLYLLGQPTSSESWGTIDSRGPGHVFTTMQYPGCVAHLEGGWNLPTKTPFKMAFRAIFERAAMIFDGCPLTVYQPDKEPLVPEFQQMAAEGGGNISSLGGYYLEIEYFVNKVLSGGPLEVVTPQTSRASLEATLGEIEKIKAKSGG